MKSIIHLVSVIALIYIVSACGNKTTTKLDTLFAQRDSLRKEQDALLAKIAAVDAQISLIDTSIKRINVTSYTLVPSYFAHYFEIYGNVESDQNIQVLPEVAGEIKTILVKEGDLVKKGQKLVQINDEIIAKNIAELQTAYSLANDVFNRQKRLWDQKIGSEMQFLESKNNKESLEQSLKTLQTQQAMASIEAPFDGVVDQIFVKTGEMAGPGMPLLRIVNLQKQYVRADVSEAYLGRVKKGTEVKLQFPSLNMEIDTSISLVGQFINPQNRTFNVRVNLESNNELLKPNLLALMLIKDFEQDSAIVVPTDMVQETSKGESFVYTLQKDQNGTLVRKTFVEVGKSYNNQTHVLSGLKANDVLIDKGARSVQDGQYVKVVE
jgi:membrane fusion protein, multidrug efflux system